MKKMNIMKAMKITMVVVLLFSTISVIQATQYPMTLSSFEFSTPGFDYYKPFSEQSNMSGLYSPSEVSLKDNLLLFGPGPAPNGWLEMPYGEIENALKIPVGNGLGILIMILLGYAVRIKSQRSRNNRQN